MDQTYNFREYARYTALSVVGMLALSCYILADTFFVSKSLGTEGLAALNIAIPVYNFIHGTGLMLGMGGATRFSICRSRGARREADEMFTNTLYMAAGFSVLFAALGLFFSGELAALLGADEEIFAMSRTYMQVLLLFSPAFILNDIFVCYVRNDGNPQLSMAATAGGSFSNIVLDYVFMFPLGMGIFGAVLATGLAPVIGIAIMSPHWLKASKGFHAVRTGLSAAHVRNNLAPGLPLSAGPALLGDRDYRVQCDYSAPYGKYRGGGLRGGGQSVPGDCRCVYGHRPGNPAACQQGSMGRGIKRPSARF